MISISYICVCVGVLESRNDEHDYDRVVLIHTYFL